MENSKEKQAEQNFLRMTIDLGRVKIELGSRESLKCLHEINKVLDKVNHAFYGISDDDAPNMDYRLETFFSDEPLLDRKVVRLLDSLSQIYRTYKTSRVAVENKKVVELEKGKVANQIDIADVNKSVAQLLFHLPRTHVKHAVIHVKGNISQEEVHKIVDHIERELGNAVIHSTFTKGEVTSHTIVECVFFGNFNSELGDEN